MFYEDVRLCKLQVFQRVNSTRNELCIWCSSKKPLTGPRTLQFSVFVSGFALYTHTTHTPHPCAPPTSSPHPGPHHTHFKMWISWAIKISNKQKINVHSNSYNLKPNSRRFPHMCFRIAIAEDRQL